jgi:hypothetical protein
MSPSPRQQLPLQQEGCQLFSSPNQSIYGFERTRCTSTHRRGSLCMVCVLVRPKRLALILLFFLGYSTRAATCLETTRNSGRMMHVRQIQTMFLTAGHSTLHCYIPAIESAIPSSLHTAGIRPYLDLLIPRRDRSLVVIERNPATPPYGRTTILVLWRPLHNASQWQPQFGCYDTV